MKALNFIRGQGLAAAAVLALGVLLPACGTDNPSGVTVTTITGAPAGAVGMNGCMTCHASQVTDWLTSGHANMADGNLNTAGTPTYGEFPAGSSCANCHDPLGDGRNLIGGVSGNVSRPVIGCESCHGGGSEHQGTGPISLLGSAAAGTVGSAQFNTCTGCHELLDSAGTGTATAVHAATAPTGQDYTITDTHFAQSPFGRIAGFWGAADGKHTFVSLPGVTAVSGYAMDFTGERVCTNCHNPHRPPAINREWAQSAHGDRFSNKNGFFSGAWSYYNWSCDGSSLASCGTPTPRSMKACQRCHTTAGYAAYADALRSGDEARAESIRLGAVSLVTATATFKPEMLKCNGCHTDNKGGLRNPGAVTANYDLDVTGGSKRSIASFSYPDITGSNVCMLCHIGRENGETIKGLNDPSLLSAGTITSADLSRLSFINSHYLTGGATVFTASGYEFDGRPYNNISAYRHDKIGTDGAPGTGTNGPCIGCHMSRPNRNGNHLFLPVSRDDTGVIGIASDVCFTCHGPSSTLILDLVKEQRELYHESLEALKVHLEKRGIYFRDFVNYFWQLRTNSTLQGGATATVTLPRTVSLVSVTTPTIVAGSSPDFFRLDADGTYYQISAVDTVNKQLTLAADYTGSVTAGEFTIIRSSGTQNWLTTSTWAYPAQTADTDKTGAVTGKNNLGAAFNFNLLDHDPGAYVHNRIYVKRLIYDSIDWLDDNRMNYSVGATLGALNAATSPFKAAAMTYLLPNGVITGVAAERP